LKDRRKDRSSFQFHSSNLGIFISCFAKIKKIPERVETHTRNYMTYNAHYAIVIITDLVSLRKNGSSRRCGLHMSQVYVSYI